MAEILLSLTIIGVVAAITLPSLTGNINERTWNTQRKALYARFSQAIALMPSLNGYGSYSGTNSSGVVTVTEDTAAEAFVTDGLAKVLKINNICDADHLQDCGVVASFTNMAGNKKSWPTKLSELNNMFTSSWYDETAGETHQNPQNNIDTKAAAFETANGESIAVYYNPYCESGMNETYKHYAQPKMCANFIYDLNGSKGPNTVGKDIGFITALYSTDSKVTAPMPLIRAASDSSQIEAQVVCKTIDSESRLPNIDELSAMFYNKMLIEETVGGAYWSGSVISAGETGKAWRQNFATGYRNPWQRDQTWSVRCIKR